MIKIKDLNNQELQKTDLDLSLRQISNFEQEKIYGGIWVYDGNCNKYWIK